MLQAWNGNPSGQLTTTGDRGGSTLVAGAMSSVFSSLDKPTNPVTSLMVVKYASETMPTPSSWPTRVMNVESFPMLHAIR